MKPTPSVYVIQITEFERGWGSRPEGYYVFEDKAAGDAWVRRETADRTGPAPDVYDAYTVIGYRSIGPNFENMLRTTKAERIHIDKLSELSS